VLINVADNTNLDNVVVKSTIRIHHISGNEYTSLRKKALKFGEKIAQLRGYNSVHDKMTSKSVCKENGLPHGFDGPMYPFGIHVDTYDPKNVIQCTMV